MFDKRWLVAASFALVCTAVNGCAVGESDVQRWEGTERGPEKLVAVLTHDKYAIPLRTDAALALIRMKPRAGKRIGLDDLNTALGELDEESLKKIVIGMTPELVKQITAVPPPHKPDAPPPPDPSIPYKDAAFAMLSHEPPFIKDEKSKTDIQNALVVWAQTDFEDRIENNSQAYGVEQMVRFLGAPSVKGLAALINDQSTKIDRIAGLVADLGDPDTKLKGSAQLVALAKSIDSPAWIEKQKPLVIEANTKAGNTTVKPELLAKQLDTFQEQELTKVFSAMKRLGGRPVIDYCLDYGANPKNGEERRKAAFAALEGRVDKNSPADVDKIFAVAKDDATPDSIRDLAFARLGELPKEQVVPKLYTLFEPKNWKVRWTAASLVLRTMTTKSLPEFMRHLPSSPAQKMGMSEAFGYGELISKMDAPNGEPKPKDAIAPYLNAHEIGPKLVALGFYNNGKKADIGLVSAHESDATPVPHCSAEDQCHWVCGVPKAPGSADLEDKEVKTVGDFAKLCVEPYMTN